MTRVRTRLQPPADSPDRREFLRVAGFAVLAVHCVPSAALASGRPRAEATQGPDDLIIESGPGAFHHVHYLRIPKASLATPPPQGAELTTTKALLHRHRVALTQDDLRNIGRGETVIQRASSHVFLIALAKGTSLPG